MTTTRYFSSAMLRADEEVDESLVGLMPCHAAVEFDGDRPIVAVWQTLAGARRIVWYGRGPASDFAPTHSARYADEPFWIVERGTDRVGNPCASVLQCDSHGSVVARRSWTFDSDGQPRGETELDASGAVLVERTHDVGLGIVIHTTEKRAPLFAAKETWRPGTILTPELSAAPFPCGGMIGSRVRILDVIHANELQGRYRSAFWTGERWIPSVTTAATISHKALERNRAALEMEGEHVARRLAEGDVVHPRQINKSIFYGVTEAAPEGMCLDELVRAAPLDASDAIRITLQLADVVDIARERGHRLGGIRPELVFLRHDTSGYSLSYVAHRAEVVFDATHRGESMLLPPGFMTDFESSDDVFGLAQLLWFMVTGGHPFLPREHVRWTYESDFWNGRREPQPWTGPGSLGPILERCLFAPADKRLSFDELVAELERIGAMLQRAPIEV